MQSLVKGLAFQELHPDTVFQKRWRTAASHKTGPERPRRRYNMRSCVASITKRLADASPVDAV